MNILLVMPPFHMKQRYGKGFEKIGSVLPPLGLLYLASFLEKNKHKVQIIDTQLNNWSPSETAEQAAKSKAHIVGIYCNTSNYKHAVIVADELKKMKNVMTVFGGPHVTTRPKEVLSNKSVDYAVIGEGEHTFSELIDYISKKKGRLSSIKGIGYKSKGQIKINEPRSKIKNLDELPFPARHLIDMDRYKASPNQYKRQPTTTIVASRGCPYSCSFCDVETIWGRGYRVRSVKNVVAELKHLVKEYGIRDVNFWDDLWGLNKEWVKEFCREILKEKIDITWCCECRVNTIDPEVLRLMKKAGCWAIFFGIESLDQEVLDAINKRTSVKMIEDALRWTKRAGIEVRANLILALPKETPKKALTTLNKLCKLNPDYVKFNVLTPYPETPVYSEIKSGMWGKMMSEQYDRLTGYFATFVPDGYSDLKQIDAMKKFAYRKYYFRPRYVMSRVLSIRGFEDLKRFAKGLTAIKSI